MKYLFVFKQDYVAQAIGDFDISKNEYTAQPVSYKKGQIIWGSYVPKGGGGLAFVPFEQIVKLDLDTYSKTNTGRSFKQYVTVPANVVTNYSIAPTFALIVCLLILFWIYGIKKQTPTTDKLTKTLAIGGGIAALAGLFISYKISNSGPENIYSSMSSPKTI